MRILNNLVLISVLLLIFSCKKSTEENDPIIPPVVGNYNFTINQNIENIKEMDTVRFTISCSVNNTSITNITWYVNNNQVNVFSNSYFDKIFSTVGNYTVKAKIDYYKSDNSLATSTIEKNIVVNERTKYLVKINKVEVLGYTGMSNFYISTLGYSLKSKFIINEKDESNLDVIKFTSTENFQNCNNASFNNMTWDISSANYQVKVFQSGNYYPLNQQGYNTEIDFYGANVFYGTSYQYLGILYLNLNPYRSLKPSIIDVNTSSLQIRLTVEWN